MAFYHYTSHAPRRGVTKSGITQKRGNGRNRTLSYCKDNPEEMPHHKDAAAWDDPLDLELDADTLTEARRVEARHHRLLRVGEAIFRDRRHPAGEAAYAPKSYAEATAMMVVGSHNASKAVARRLGVAAKRGTADTDVAADELMTLLEDG